MKIYVASSWRNNRQPEVVAALRKAGHAVYDFKNPMAGDNGFSWKEIDKNWENWTTSQFKDALFSEPAERGFQLDSNAVLECDALVLVLPCGKSAHLEAGYAAGKGKLVFALIENKEEPELMYKWFDRIVDTMPRLIGEIGEFECGNLMTDAYRARGF